MSTANNTLTTAEDAFEAAIVRALGERVREDRETAKALWGAITNVRWRHESYGEAGFSWRVAGHIIADILGQGCYMDWYMCAEAGVVRDDIFFALSAEGWIPIREVDNE
jgi:hypothetical protein